MSHQARQPRRDRKREARQAHTGQQAQPSADINATITRAQQDTQPHSPRNFHFRGRGQVRDMAPPGARGDSHVPGQSAGRGLHVKQRTSLMDRTTHDEQPQQARGSNPPPAPKLVTGKRGRDEHGEEQPNKEARLTTEAEHTRAPNVTRQDTVVKTAVEDGTQRKGTGKTPPAQQSEEERRAARAIRFAPRREPVKAVAVYQDKQRTRAKESKDDHKPTSIEEPTEPAAAAAVAGQDSPKNKLEANLLANQSGYGHESSQNARCNELADTAAIEPKKTAEKTTPTTTIPSDRECTSHTPPLLPSPRSSKASLPSKDNSPSLKRSRAEAATDSKEIKEKTTPTATIPSDRGYTSPIPPPLPLLLSPTSSKDSSPSAKRPRAEADGSEEHSHKRPRLGSGPNRPSSPKRNVTVLQTDAKPKNAPGPKTKKAKSDRRDDAKRELQRHRVVIKDECHAPVEPNPECKLEFFGYGADSVPVLYSTSIKHTDGASLVTEASIYLRQDALALLRREWTSEDLGRANVPHSSEPARIIDDCDLYFRNGKVYVATERGLLLAADYLKLIGIPDTQSVRFNGRKPAWTKSAEAQIHYRRVKEHYAPSTTEEEKQGNIELIFGSTIMVFERTTERTDDGELIEMAYGMRLNDGVKGWFLYNLTCRMDGGSDTPSSSEATKTTDPAVIDWCKFDYSRLAAIAAANYAARPPAPHWPSLTSPTATPAPPAPPAPTAPTPVGNLGYEETTAKLAESTSSLEAASSIAHITSTEVKKTLEASEQSKADVKGADKDLNSELEASKESEAKAKERLDIAADAASEDLSMAADSQTQADKPSANQESAKSTPQNTSSPHQSNRYADEDIVDYSDSEL